MPRPRHGRSHHAVFRTGYARDLGADPHGYGAEAHAAPERLAAGIVVDMAFPSAHGALPSLFLADMDVHDKRKLAVRILAEVEGVDCVLSDCSILCANV